LLTILFAFYTGWTTWSIFRIWPVGGDVPFVWQAALAETAVALDQSPAISSAAVAGWSPDTLDGPTMALYLRRADLSLSHFGVQAGEDIIYTLVIPTAAENEARHMFVPTVLPLASELWQKLETWGGETAVFPAFAHITLPVAPTIQPQFPTAATFGDQLQLLGYDLNEDCSLTPTPAHPLTPCLVTYWQVAAPITQPLRLFVHALDADGNVLAEDYRWDTADPQNLWQPHWQPGDVIMQIHPLDLTNAAQLRLGLFDPYTCDPGPCQNVFTQAGEAFVLVRLQTAE